MSIAVAAHFWRRIGLLVGRPSSLLAAVRAVGSRPFRLQTHLVCLSAIVVMPGLVIGTATTVLLSDALNASGHRGIGQAARILAVTLDDRIGRLTRGALAALAADVRESGGGAVFSDEHVPRLAAVLAVWGADWLIWRGQPGGLAPGPATPGAPAALAADEFRRLAARAAGLEQSGPDHSGLDHADLVVPAAGDKLPVALLVMAPLPADIGMPGVLQIALPPPLANEILALVAVRPDANIRLVAPDGRTAAWFDAADPIPGDDARDLPARALAEAAAQDDGSDVTAPSGQPIRIAAAGLPHHPGWRVVLTEAARGPAIPWLVPGMALLGLGSLVAAVAVAAWLGKRLSRPLIALTHDASAVGAGAVGSQPKVPSGNTLSGAGPCAAVREFQELSASLVRSTALLRRRAAAERMALDEARTGHELLASVVKATEDLIYVKNVDLHLVLANRATLCVGGVVREEWQVLGHGIGALLPGRLAAREEALDRRALAGNERIATRIEWPDAGGAVRSFHLSKSLWRDGAGRIIGVVTVGHDVTDQRAAEARLAVMQADLLRVSRLSAMGAMASGLAHELNQPLAAATNFLNAASRMLDMSAGPAGSAGGERARAAVDEAADQMLRARDIVRRLRAFIGRGGAALEPEDLADVIRQACDLCLVDGAAGSADLVVDAAPGEIALLDRTQFQQVLLNLVRNASEAIAAGAIGTSGGATSGAPASEMGRIEIGCARQPDGSVCITVADNGPGLAPHLATRLFDPFVSTKHDGLGIGLVICRTIVEGHGGQLAAADRPGGGMVFSIVLPPVLDTRHQEPADVG
jgi:two-component system sensor kinase FixL